MIILSYGVLYFCYIGCYVFSFIFYFLWVLFILMHLTKDLSVLLIFSKNEKLHWAYLCFFLFSLLFILSLIFIIFFLLLILDFVLLYLILLGGMFFIWHSSGLLRYICIAISFTLRTAVIISHTFWKVAFLFSFFLRYFLISYSISSMTHWGFCCVLFILHMFVFWVFPISFCNWISSFI